ncbi:IS3 family transposase [Wolbachia endosymbiont (group A) of Aleiodes leptofemur]|uniref:IS3 family transposase n=1 Tax=Wolbachia endosymbiont (group A) of Aleiodes leptofemur TaxID=3077919 RepID=UPI00333F5178
MFPDNLYKWTTRKISSRESANKELLEAIQKIYQVSKCRYGAPKIHAELKALGKSCNLKTVQSIMQKNDIRAILKRKFRCMVPESDGILSSSFKESLWDRYYMGAPKQHRRFVEQYKIEKRA